MRLCTGLMYSAVRGQVTFEREGRGAAEFPLPESQLASPELAYAQAGKLQGQRLQRS